MKRNFYRFTGIVGMLLLCSPIFITTCNDVPLHDVAKTFAVEVSEVSENQEPVQIDFLWVIDLSASMCQEQYALALSFNNFVEELQKYLKNIDIRLAVTTTDGLSPNRGDFNTTPAKDFPPACFETRYHPCGGDGDCEKEYGKGWSCKPPQNLSALYNLNHSINSTCTFRCNQASECCGEFCFGNKCGQDQSCLLTQCADAPNENCSYECKHPGGGTSLENSGCLRPPETKDCPGNLPAILTMKNIDLFKCIATVQPEQSYQANLEQGLKSAWLALDPNGENAKQASGFLRPDAYLVIVFVTDEDDCSIDEEFASPSYTCESDAKCLNGAGDCKTDVYYSKMMGQQIELCYGLVKKDYYNNCSLLGEYKGLTHHNCAYDQKCDDCVADEDCDYGWQCNNNGKCRPSIYSLQNIATYQAPPGAPINALSPVSKYYSLFRSLKSDPAKVLVAAIVADGQVKSPSTKNSDKDEPEKPSYISTACMEREDLLFCQDYAEARATASEDCIADPEADGCEEYYEKKLDCIRECYIASKGDAQNQAQSKNSYICLSDDGKGDFGSRYVRLAEMFGPNGMVSNTCSEDGIVPALRTIAELVIKRVTKICLPMEVKGGESIVVIKTIVHDDGSQDEPEILSEGDSADGGEYRIEFPTQECCYPNEQGECTGTLKAITFNDVLDPGARIEVRYEAAVE
jgi:hypothetical protein